MSSVTGSALPRASTVVLALVVSLASVARADDAAPQRDLSTLMHYFAASRGVEVHFREEKSLPLLQAPLVSEGVLYYAPPGRMARFTTQPEPTSLLVLEDRLRMEDGLGVEEIDLDAHPQARRFVSQLMLLFQGDQEALERDYDVLLVGDGAAWSLTLRPRDRALRQVIREIALSGREAELDEMIVTGTQDEITRTTYSQTRSDRPFAEAELEALFPAEGAPVAPPPSDATPQ